MGEVFDPVFDDTCCAQGGGVSSRQRAKSGRGSCIFAGMANRPPMPTNIPTPNTKPSERIKDGTGHTLFFWRVSSGEFLLASVGTRRQNACVSLHL